MKGWCVFSNKLVHNGTEEVHLQTIHHKRSENQPKITTTSDEIQCKNHNIQQFHLLPAGIRK